MCVFLAGSVDPMGLLISTRNSGRFFPRGKQRKQELHGLSGRLTGVHAGKADVFSTKSVRRIKVKITVFMGVNEHFSRMRA